MNTTKTFFKSFLFIYILLGILLLICLFLPFKIEITLSGQSVSIFGGNSFVKGGEKTITKGWNFRAVVIPFVVYFITLIFSIFGKRKVGKVFTLISGFIMLLSLPLLYLGICFAVNIFGPRIDTFPGLGFYLFALFSLVFITLIVIQVIKTWNIEVERN